MDTNTSFTIVMTMSIISLCSMSWVWNISNAWVNTPSNYSIDLNMNKETKEAVIAVSNLQKEILELELKKLELEINNSLNKNVSCLVGWYIQLWNESSDSYYNSEEMHFSNPDACYVIN